MNKLYKAKEIWEDNEIDGVQFVIYAAKNWKTLVLYTVSGLNLDSETDGSGSGMFLVFLRRKMAGYYLKLDHDLSSQYPLNKSIVRQPPYHSKRYSMSS
jgi:hypothetical protein